jgi:transcriptional regulator with XRE-family HTH domain
VRSKNPNEDGDQLFHPKKPTSIDAMIGVRIRARREALGMSRDQLASVLSVGRTAIQKYEQGDSRVSPSRLVAIAAALGVSAGSFFASTASQTTIENQEVDTIRPALLAVYDSLDVHKRRRLLYLALELQVGHNDD